MLIFANAKINLGLHVVEKRPDGYHNLETVFYPVPLYDVLEIVETAGEEVKFFNYGTIVDAPFDKNSCVKAYRLIREKYHVPASEIHLYKHIPSGAGLGGGSSDATHTLLLINRLYNLDIPLATLAEMALQLGSDCPFFLYNKPMFATGRGEVLEPIELSLSGKYIVLVKPPLHVSTAEAYRGIVPQKPAHDLRQVVQMPVAQWRQYLKNDFEVPIFEKYPLLKDIKNELYAMGAVYAAMSGSGSTLYGIFDREVKLSSVFTGCFVWTGLLP
jgi:4-diphosphocytidyl-2-C-methyl-D-erythritol kinase